MIRTCHFKTGRRGTIRMALLGIIIGAAIAAAIAWYYHQTRACMTDGQIAEYLTRDITDSK